MRFHRKFKWLVLIILSLSFLTLSLASACMIPDWAPKADDCCAIPCRNVSSPELAKSFCHLSTQQRSLHAGPQLPAPAVLVEDGLALIAQSLKAPPPVFSSQFDPDCSLQQPHGDLYILHRTLLL
ncbi:MAG: hypothetical protein LLH30_15070 [Candidatus Manganitrophus sp. SA1]|nr:hypothetical protein [Candidatus Manganitrophus morganii]